MKHTHPKGSALLHTLLILSIVVSASFGTYFVLNRQISQTTDFAQGVRAFYAAESGAEQLLYEVRKQGKGVGTVTASRDLSNNTAWKSSGETGLSDFVLSLTKDEVFELSLYDPNNQATHININSLQFTQLKVPLEITIIAWNINDPVVYGLEKVLVEGVSYTLDLTNIQFNGAVIKDVNHSFRNYRVRLRALDGVNSFRVVSSPDKVPYMTRVKTTGESPKASERQSNQAIEMIFSNTPSVPSLFDFVMFSQGPIIKPDGANQWIKTENGDVHALANLNGGVAKGGDHNATYLVTAGGSISNFTSVEMTGKQKQMYQIPSNVLWGPDVAFISSNAISIPQNFGHDGEIRLNGYVYTMQGQDWDFKTTGALDDIFLIGPNSGYAGSGVFYRNGDLTIKDNIYIDDVKDVGADIKEVPVVAFVVEGDLSIDPAVTNVSGFFYVTGSVHTGASDKQLTIEGAVVASGFNLERNTNGNNADEVFIYDPRVFINPPPGFLR